MLKTLFAFTRDLRLEDQLGLAEAARHGEVIPVLVLDPARGSRLRASSRRAAYYCAAVAALAEEIEARGARLIVRRGSTAATLRSLARGLGAQTVAWSAGYDAKEIRADRDIQSALEESGLRVIVAHDAPVVPPEDTALAHRRGDGWRAFVPYFERWRSLDARRERAGGPADPGRGGERGAARAGRVRRTSGLDGTHRHGRRASKLDAFLSGPILSYGVARNVPGAGPTSELAADLSFGTIAARTVVRAACERAADPFLLVEETTSVRLWLRALAQRDFFLQLAWYNDTLEDVPLQEKMRGFAFERTHPQLAAWRSGTTGFPLVDAGIRELRATGRMHPRIRAVAASFLCFDLGVDWRIGRDDWDHFLIEDSPALANGNWQWIAGVGADLVAYPRIYNPVKQAHRFDPGAAYVRRWIPELAGLPDAADLRPPRRSAPARPAALRGARLSAARSSITRRRRASFLARYRAEVTRQEAIG